MSLCPIKFQNEILRKLQANEIAPKMRKRSICLLKVSSTTFIIIIICSGVMLSEVFPTSENKSEDIYACIGIEIPAPILPIKAKTIKK